MRANVPGIVQDLRAFANRFADAVVTFAYRRVLILGTDYNEVSAERKAMFAVGQRRRRDNN